MSDHLTEPISQIAQQLLQSKVMPEPLLDLRTVQPSVWCQR